MRAMKLIAVLLVLAGVLGLVYGGFNYPKSDHVAKLGSMEFAVKTEGRTPIPVWAGAVAVAFGTLLLLIPVPKR